MTQCIKIPLQRPQTRSPVSITAARRKMALAWQQSHESDRGNTNSAYSQGIPRWLDGLGSCSLETLYGEFVVVASLGDS